MSINYRVELFQINVSQDYRGGDCAIILLLDADPRVVNGQTIYTPEVLKAVLVDGGDEDGAKFFLTKTMQDCEMKYIFQNSPGNKFKFDAVCISHWDRVSS